MPSKKVQLAQNPVNKERLGFRLDEQTKDLIERAARLESRKLTDFCVAVLIGSCDLYYQAATD